MALFRCVSGGGVNSFSENNPRMEGVVKSGGNELKWVSFILGDMTLYLKKTDRKIKFTIQSESDTSYYTDPYRMYIDDNLVKTQIVNPGDTKIFEFDLNNNSRFRIETQPPVSDHSVFIWSYKVW